MSSQELARQLLLAAASAEDPVPLVEAARVLLASARKTTPPAGPNAGGAR